MRCPYRRIRLLGEGAAADVYLCVDIERRRLVVVKWLRAELTDQAGSVARFRREAELMADGSLVGVIAVEEHGTDDDGRFWMSMDFVDGRSPAAVIRPGNVWGVHRLLDGVGRSLDDLHAVGIVHRDLKPDNVILRHIDPRVPRGWEPVVIDLGIAKWFAHDTATMTGSVLGTPHYMSPEQLQDSKHVGPSTDRYALAVIAYELLSGAVPHGGNTLADLLRAAVKDPVPPLRIPVASGEPKVETPHLDAFMSRALAKQPDQRFSRGTELAAAFRAAAERDRVWAEPLDPPPLFEFVPAPMIEVRMKDGERWTFDVRDGPIIFGRHEKCQVVVQSPRVSRLHACVYSQRGRLWFCDLESHNGTRCSGRVLRAGRPAPIPTNAAPVTALLYDREVEIRALPA